jgi:hypothetical protein
MKSHVGEKDHDLPNELDQEDRTGLTMVTKAM